MNVFSRVRGALAALLSVGGQPVLPHQAESPELDTPKPRHTFRIRTTTGTPVRGPAFPGTREGHHVSRQTSRAFLRTRFFAGVSEGNPLMSRRERRRFSRLFACLEYRRMMHDPTNAIPDDERLMYERLDRMKGVAA